MPEEKEQINELSIEQMKELISVAALLPPLINKINAIDNTLQHLVKTQETLSQGVISILKQYEGYKDEVEELTSKIVTKNDLENINDEINNIKSLLSSLQLSNEKPEEKIEKPKPKRKKKVESDDEKVNRLVESIIKNQKSGQKISIHVAIYDEKKVSATWQNNACTETQL